MPYKVPGVIEGILKAMDVMGFGEKYLTNLHKELW